MEEIKRIMCQQTAQAQSERFKNTLNDSLKTIKDILKTYFNGEFEFKNPKGDKPFVECVYFDYWIAESRDVVIKCLRINESGELRACVVDARPFDKDCNTYYENWREYGEWKSLEKPNLDICPIFLSNAYQNILDVFAMDDYLVEE